MERTSGDEVNVMHQISRRELLNASAAVLAGGDELVGDTLLVAVGRRPNVEGLDPKRAGVAHDADTM